MTHDSRSRRTRAFAAVVVALAVALSASGADARAGSSSSSGSRGTRTYTPPPATSTAPTTAAPMERSMTTPTAPRPATPQAAPAPAPSRGLFGGGFMSGLMGGLIGAGIGSLLFGGGFFSGLGSFAGILGFILQIVLVVALVRLALRFFRGRNANPAPAYANAGEPLRREGGPMEGGPLGGLGGGIGGGPGGGGPRPRDEVGIGPQDYQEFERLLGSIQLAYAAEDLATLRGMVSPEMLSYFSGDLAANASRGVANRISDVRLLQGDLSEAWREGGTEYATVAMRFSLIDVTVDRATGRVVEGNPNQPAEAVELWTFVRSQGGRWILSAIQQTR